jgi:hypothetical protein
MDRIGYLLLGGWYDSIRRDQEAHRRNIAENVNANVEAAGAGRIGQPQSHAIGAADRRVYANPDWRNVDSVLENVKGMGF